MKRIFSLFFTSVLCIAASCTGSGTIGDSCKEKSDCTSKFCFLETYDGEFSGWQDGYCSNECSADKDCGSGASCRELEDGYYCLSLCTSAENCREGYICDIDWQVCVPDCRLKTDWCPQGYVCGEDGSCIDEALANIEKASKNLGDPCIVNWECISDYCIPEKNEEDVFTGWSEGFCSKICRGDLDCDTGNVCRPIGEERICLTTCSSNQECRNGYVCDMMGRMCLPDCRLGWSCGENLTCMQQDGLCRPEGGPGGDYPDHL